MEGEGEEKKSRIARGGQMEGLSVHKEDLGNDIERLREGGREKEFSAFKAGW